METSTSNTIPMVANAKKSIPLYGTIYSKPNQLGDFNWMCKQPKYNNTLFIFNDNEEYRDTCRTGKGNAIIRKYNKYNDKLKQPKSAGIPTGTLAKGGYRQLDLHVIKVVEQAISEIKDLLDKYNYDAIIYSVASNGKLGTGLFNVSQEVIDHIDSKIKSLTNIPIQIIQIVKT